MGMAVKRGALIVLEGVDKSGKSTQCEKLYDFLCNNNRPAKLIGFPARQTSIGKLIDSYLNKQQDYPDEAIHLLFTANRWESQNEMKRLLESGTTLVVDRYSYSGLAYRVARGIPFDWCMSPEKGLIEPDRVFYMHAPVEVLAQRANYGEERYEKTDFQRKVTEVFDSMCDNQQSLWQKIDATSAKEAITTLITMQTLQVIQNVEDKPLNFIT